MINSDNEFIELRLATPILLSRTHSLSHRPIKDSDIVGRWRRFFGEHMKIEELQEQLIAHWKPYMEQTHSFLDDVTCYESYIKYSADVKLLWDCSEYLFGTIEQLKS